MVVKPLRFVQITDVFKHFNVFQSPMLPDVGIYGPVKGEFEVPREIPELGVEVLDFIHQRIGFIHCKVLLQVFFIFIMNFIVVIFDAKGLPLLIQERIDVFCIKIILGRRIFVKQTLIKDLSKVRVLLKNFTNPTVVINFVSFFHGF